MSNECISRAVKFVLDDLMPSNPWPTICDVLLLFEQHVVGPEIISPHSRSRRLDCMLYVMSISDKRFSRLSKFKESNICHAWVAQRASNYAVAVLFCVIECLLEKFDFPVSTTRHYSYCCTVDYVVGHKQTHISVQQAERLFSSSTVENEHSLSSLWHEFGFSLRQRAVFVFFRSPICAEKKNLLLNDMMVSRFMFCIRMTCWRWCVCMRLEELLCIFNFHPSNYESVHSGAIMC